MKPNFAGSEYRMEEINDILKFVLAGDSIFTLKSTVSGTHYTYNVSKLKNKDKNIEMYFVHILRGPNNMSDYTYLGVIKNNEFSLTKNSKYTAESTCFKAFDLFFKDLMKLHIHSKMEFYHLGVCGKCGRPLTVPESIKFGIGPICMGM